LLPDLPRERIFQIGNAAGAGAVMMLCSSSVRRRAVELARKSRYIELTSYPGFMNLFVDHCRLPVQK
jgi:uncharacterized 2Fe-2S/4Fe-4S cluster protein (DUF4445 family)